MDLPLPAWSSQDTYDKIVELNEIIYQSHQETPKIKQLLVGPTIETILENMEKQEKGIAKVKMYLYSAHDLNVEPFISVHNISGTPKLSDFGSAAIVEKRRGIDGKIYIRVTFSNFHFYE